jgi:hypothetical protein
MTPEQLQTLQFAAWFGAGAIAGLCTGAGLAIGVITWVFRKCEIYRP